MEMALIASLVAEYLRFRKIPYTRVSHLRAVTCLEEARALEVPADEVLKTVIIDAAGGHVLAVIPASRRLDMRKLRKALDDPHASLATESELGQDFTGYELGAMPPLGGLVGARTVVDPQALEHQSVLFAAGSQTDSIAACPADLFASEDTVVAPISRDRPQLAPGILQLAETR
jgi:prolyl-tRNA editing enzyme YbaK/EbsC (Cys-tRNA(Pro) deacylase)